MESMSFGGRGRERRPSFEIEPNPEKEPQPPYTIPSQLTEPAKVSCTVIFYGPDQDKSGNVVYNPTNRSTHIEGLVFSHHGDAVKVVAVNSETDKIAAAVMYKNRISSVFEDEARVFFLHEVYSITFYKNDKTDKKIYNFHLI